MKLQTSLYTIQRAAVTSLDATTDEIQWFPAMQILVTFSVGLFSQVDIVYTCIKQLLEVHDALDQDGIKGKGYLDQEIKNLYKHAYYKTAFIILFFMLTSWISFYSMLQFVMCHTCKVSLWNLSGCADGDDRAAIMYKLEELTGIGKLVHDR